MSPKETVGLVFCADTSIRTSVDDDTNDDDDGTNERIRKRRRDVFYDTDDA